MNPSHWNDICSGDQSILPYCQKKPNTIDMNTEDIKPAHPLFTELFNAVVAKRQQIFQWLWKLHIALWQCNSTHESLIYVQWHAIGFSPPFQELYGISFFTDRGKNTNIISKKRI